MKGGLMLWILGIPLALIAAAFLYWQLRYPTHTYRFELIVEVETPSGLRSGSSVYEVKARNLPEIFPEGATREWAVRGEAVAVDLADGQTLFALMQPDLTRTSLRTLDPVFNGDFVASAARIAKGEGNHSKSVISDEDLPLLVTFEDIIDPTSLVRVPGDDLGVFGRNVRLKRMTVELTEKPVTIGIEQRLLWLDDLASFRTEPTNPFTSTLPPEISGLRSN